VNWTGTLSTARARFSFTIARNNFAWCSSLLIGIWLGSSGWSGAGHFCGVFLSIVAFCYEVWRGGEEGVKKEGVMIFN
jgi:hypothetical protein